MMTLPLLFSALLTGSSGPAGEPVLDLTIHCGGEYWLGVEIPYTVTMQETAGTDHVGRARLVMTRPDHTELTVWMQPYHLAGNERKTRDAKLPGPIGLGVYTLTVEALVDGDYAGSASCKFTRCLRACGP